MDAFDKKLFDIDKSAPAYYRLGEFVSEFAGTEYACRELFNRVCGLNEDVVRILLNGVRLNDLLPALKRLVEMNSFSESDKRDFRSCADQLHTISGFRNRLVHYGFDPFAPPDALETSNWLAARSREAIEVLKFEIDHMKSAAEDLTCITWQLSTLGQPRRFEDLPPAGLEAVLRPWRYKPVEPDTPNRPRRGSRRSQRRRSPPSDR